MKQSIFLTRNRAEELSKEVLSIWQNGNHKESLMGIENDPVFSLLITALAYQSNEIDSEIERLKTEVLEDFAQILLPESLGRSTPASVVLKSMPNDNISEIEVTSNDSFFLTGSSHSFMPLMKGRIINARAKRTDRLDGRRWTLSMEFKEPIQTLDGVSFMIHQKGFSDLKISYKQRTLPLIKPWDCANLPLTKCFAVENLLYNNGAGYDATAKWFDLFAQQDLRIFYFDQGSQIASSEQDAVSKLDLELEFFGVNKDFDFRANDFSLNIIPLINAEQHFVTLSESSPIAKVNKLNEDGASDFLYLVSPSELQVNRNAEVVVRRVESDRFNIASLLKLASAITERFSSDYYAFQNIPKLRNGNKINQLYSVLSSIKEDISASDTLSSGIYIMLRKRLSTMSGDSSLSLSYLTTSGAKVNRMLTPESRFTLPSGLNAAATEMVTKPIEGRDENCDTTVKSYFANYLVATNDRLVTPADIKIFCYKELMERYNIAKNNVQQISIRHQQVISPNHVGFEIGVAIHLKSSEFLLKNIIDKVAQAELVLQKMIEVRSAGVYPINVNINIEKV